MDTDDLIRLALDERRPPIAPDDEDEAWASIRRRAERERRHRHRPLVAAVAAVAVVLAGAGVLLRDDGRAGDPAGPSDVAADPGTTIPPGDPGTWRTLAPSSLGARYASSAVWTGDEVLVLGGTDQPCPDSARCPSPSGGLADGAAYDPATDTWRTVADAPVAFAGAPAVWTGDVALVFVNADGPALSAYDPDGDTWATRATPPMSDPQPVWTGEVAVVVDPSSADPEVEPGDWAYDPGDDTWTELPADPGGCGESRQGAWGGDRLVVFARPCPAPGTGGIEPGLYYRVATFDVATGAAFTPPAA